MINLLKLQEAFKKWYYTNSINKLQEAFKKWYYTNSINKYRILGR